MADQQGNSPLTFREQLILAVLPALVEDSAAALARAARGAEHNQNVVDAVVARFPSSVATTAVRVADAVIQEASR